MFTMNRVQLVGLLGSDPELRHTPNGTAVANLRLATNETWLDKDKNKQERTEWFTVVCWAQLAEVTVKHLKKGSYVMVDGSLRSRSWEDKDTKQKRTAVDVVAKTVGFLDRNGKRVDTASDPSGEPEGAESDGDIGDDDIPF